MGGESACRMMAEGQGTWQRQPAQMLRLDNLHPF